MVIAIHGAAHHMAVGVYRRTTIDTMIYGTTIMILLYHCTTVWYLDL